MSNRMISAVDDWLNTLDTPRRPHEHDGKRLLSRVGLAVPGGVLVEADSQSTVTRQLDRFDLSGHFAAKVCSPDILHKTEEDGVLLNPEAEELPDAVQALLSKFPGSPVLAERMVTFGGPEIIVGALAEVIETVADLAGILMHEGRQLDINPVVWDSSKWVALDVKAVL